MPRVIHNNIVPIADLNRIRDQAENNPLPSNPTGITATTGMQPTFTTTVNVSYPARVLRVLCWNTLVYNYGKAMYNPFVNAVLDRVLKELDVDIAILLETRENPSTALAAIEEGKVLDSYTEVKPESSEMEESDEDDDQEDDQDGDDDDDDDDSDERDDDDDGVKASAAPPTAYLPNTYQWIASELTGRTLIPPEELHLPNPDIKRYHKQYQGYSAPKMLLKKVSVGTDPQGNDRLWKAAYETYLHNYYDLLLSGRTILNDVKQIASHTYDQNGFVELRPRICQSCQKPLGFAMWPCKKCEQPQCGPAGPVTMTKAGKPFKRKPKNPKACTARTHTAKGCNACSNRQAAAKQVASWIEKQSPTEADTYLPNYRLPTASFLKLWSTNGKEITEVMNFYDAVAWTAPVLCGIDVLPTIPPAAEPGIVMRLKKCKTCNQLVGRQSKPCKPCEPWHPLSLNTRQLMESIQDILKFMQHLETYAVLVKQQGIPGTDGETPITTGQREEVYVGEKMAAVHRRACFLASLDSTGKDVGFRNPHNYQYNGRCPFLVPVEVIPYDATNNAPVPLWIMAYHAPFSGGEPLRAKALDKAMTLGVDPLFGGKGGTTQFKALDRAILIGDLNLDFQPTGDPSSEPNKWYANMQNANGFAVGVPGVKTSLKKILKSTKARTFYDEWKTNYRSSAYDNVLIRGAWNTMGVLQCAAVDVVAWLEANLNDFPLPNGYYQKDILFFNGLNNPQKATFIYQMFVSDHLPVVIDILVKPLTDEALAAIRKMDRQRKDLYPKTVQKRIVTLWKRTLHIAPLGIGRKLVNKEIAILVGTAVDVSDTSYMLAVDDVRVIFNKEKTPPIGKTLVAILHNPQVDHSGTLTGEMVFARAISPGDKVLELIDKASGTWIMVGQVIELGHDLHFRVQAGQFTSGLAFVKKEWGIVPKDGDTVMALFLEPSQVVA